MKTIIYILQNKINNKIYVGKTIDLIQRLRSHKSNSKPTSKRSYYLHKAINKYGLDNFIITELEIFDNEQDCFDAEQFWISFFRSWDRNIGYNISLGGKGGYGHKHTEISKKKISNSLLGNKYSLGHKHTQESKNLMSETHKGEKNNKAKITEQDVRDIRKFHKDNINSELNIFSLLKEKYNLSQGALEKIIYKQNWKHIL